MSLTKDIAALFFVPSCPVCGKPMNEGEYFICNSCRWGAPLTGFENRIDNPVAQKFWGIIKIMNGCAFMYFIHDSGYRQMIHDFKYRGNWKSARMAGEWFGGELSKSPLYGDIDLIVPIPLHRRKFLLRGYNQSEYIARGMSRSMKVDTDVGSVTRDVYNQNQALKPHHERWKNVENIFHVRHPERLSDKHILLVDDVLTTGATISSCAQTIEDSVPDCRISIACLATAIDTMK